MPPPILSPENAPRGAERDPAAEGAARAAAEGQPVVRARAAPREELQQQSLGQVQGDHSTSR